MSATLVDARGMRCPWPVLRLARAMREGGPVRLLADDPAAAREIAAIATERGWRVDRDEDAYSIDCGAS